ncbi:diaminopimelate epimerase [Nocardia sp. 2]|uniref:Diaminopimelate epimerase n=1 Tax=Nocardia acididurans TaxID=2802282 RepID=A0ABS1MEA8_9NOCA|nr:diaminopimelate epimerase [Nocardia acididurans]MBL1078899.1 diaminopimelate epimerase [Nocardia acididurans]
MTNENAADIEFSKGHGTQNDFVVLPDPDAWLELTESRVAALCDRQRGLGADGILRVARAGALIETGVLAELPADVSAGDWFMDYRNADGSIAEMCGNGVRVFAHYLVASGLEQRAEFVVGSRAGARPVVVHHADPVHGEVTVAMGPVRTLGESTASLSGREFTGLGIDVGNPHLACVDPALTHESLYALDLEHAPGFDHTLFPHGVNVEILTPLAVGADGQKFVDMRVYERGVGETRSCGTGTVAAAASALARDGFDLAHDSGHIQVRIPGGEVTVGIENGAAWLRGPSVLVATGRIAAKWWQDA